MNVKLDRSFDFVPVPGGTFIMSADCDEYIDEEVREYPKREIEIAAFEIQKTPVTVGRWYEKIGYKKRSSSKNDRPRYLFSP